MLNKKEPKTSYGAPINTNDVIVLDMSQEALKRPEVILGADVLED